MNKREIGQRHREETLVLLALVGYASTRQVARWVWDRCDNSTRKMAGRVLRRLLADGLIVAKRDNDDVNAEQLVALTKRGASEVAGLMPLVSGKVHARDYLRHAHKHRTMCNSVLVALPRSLEAGYSELEVRSGKAPLCSFEYHHVDGGAIVSKIPDLIAEHTNGALEWFEVENTWRSDADLSKVVDFMRALFAQPGEVARVHFVITDKRAKSIGERLRKRLTHGPESGWPRQIKERDARILAQHIAVSELNHDDLTLSKVSF